MIAATMVVAPAFEVAEQYAMAVGLGADFVFATGPESLAALHGSGAMVVVLPGAPADVLRAARRCANGRARVLFEPYDWMRRMPDAMP